MKVKPTPFFAATPPHGSPTLKPSMLPASMFATICGGGIGLIFVLFGSMPAAASERCSQMSCVPPGKVMANVGSFVARAASTAFLNAAKSP